MRIRNSDLLICYSGLALTSFHGIKSMEFFVQYFPTGSDWLLLRTLLFCSVCGGRCGGV